MSATLPFNQSMHLWSRFGVRIRHRPECSLSKQGIPHGGSSNSPLDKWTSVSPSCRDDDGGSLTATRSHRGPLYGMEYSMGYSTILVIVTSQVPGRPAKWGCPEVQCHRLNWTTTEAVERILMPRSMAPVHTVRYQPAFHPGPHPAAVMVHSTEACKVQLVLLRSWGPIKIDTPRHSLLQKGWSVPSQRRLSTNRICLWRGGAAHDVSVIGECPEPGN